MSEKNQMKFEILEKNRIFQEFFRVDRVDLTQECFGTGEMLKVRRYHLERPEVVALILENISQNTIVLVRQFRYSSVKYSSDNGWTTEIVGGLIDPGEAPDACAIRETLEETGYQVKEVEFITKYFASLGVSDELIHLFYATCEDADKAHAGGGLAHEHEDIEVIELPFAEALEQVASGAMTDSKSIMAIQWLALRKAGIAGFTS